MNGYRALKAHLSMRQLFLHSEYVQTEAHKMYDANLLLEDMQVICT